MKELIRNAQSGDPEAFIRLMELHKLSMYRVAKGYFAERMDAEDAISEAVMASWEKISTLKKPEFFKTWVLRILINKCNDIKRSQKRTVALDKVPEAVLTQDFYTGDALIGRLGDAYRIVLTLFYGEGYKVREIAKMLGLPAGTVSSRLKRGREQIAAMIKEEKTE